MANDDIHIEVGGAVRRHIPSRPNPLTDSRKAVVPYDSPNTDPIPVFISEEVMREIERQTLADKEREVGGVLLGGFYRNDEGSFVEVTDHIAAEKAKGTDVSLTFTHETWEQIHEQIAQRKDSVQIVGWYHSHPGLGVFMSKDDEFIHTSYFSDPWHIAIVHDPIYTNWGCFKWSDGQLDRTGGFYVFAEKKQSKRIRDYIKTQTTRRQAAPRSASSDADRLARPSSRKSPSLWAAVIVLLLVQLTVAWFTLSRQSSTTSAGDYEIARQLLRVSDLTGAESFLKRELSVHPDSEDAYRDLSVLDRVMRDKSVQNSAFDRENLLLYSTSRMAAQAKAKGKAVSPSNDDVPTPKDDSAAHVGEYAGRDPVEITLAQYESAAATRAARIARAKAVCAVAKTQWSRDALKWLQDEETRQIAYGRVSDPMKYSARYKALSAARKKAVDHVLRGEQ